MATYWVTFRIENTVANGKSYDDRWDAFYDAIKKHMTTWWVPATSFVAFDSESNIDSIAASLKTVLSAQHDLFLLGMTDFKSARIFGKNDDQTIYALVPFLKKA